MQLFRNAVLSAPTSFLVLASLRHAVRLACFAAASAEGGAEGGAVAAFAAGGALTPAAGGALAAAAAVPEVAVPGVAAPGTSARGAGGAANAPPRGSRQRHTAAAKVEKRMVISIEDSNAAGRGSCNPE
jgi:hypothetical protein